MGRSLVLVAVLAGLPATVGAQAVEFGHLTRSEECVDLLSRLKNAPGANLAVKLRFLEAKWRQFSGSNEQLLARVLQQYPCLTVTYDESQCPRLQQEVDNTVGETLGARLKLLFPKETADLREKWAEVLMHTFCPTLAVAPTAAIPARPVRVFIQPPTVEGGFVPPEMAGVSDTIKELYHQLLRSSKPTLQQAPNRTAADVVFEVESRDQTRERCSVRLRALVQGHTFEFASDGDDCDSAADTAADKIHLWIRDNTAQILSGAAK